MSIQKFSTEVTVKIVFVQHILAMALREGARFSLSERFSHYSRYDANEGFHPVMGVLHLPVMAVWWVFSMW
jgi:hypothetical protein